MYSNIIFINAKETINIFSVIHSYTINLIGSKKINIKNVVHLHLYTNIYIYITNLSYFKFDWFRFSTVVCTSRIPYDIPYIVSHHSFIPFARVSFFHCTDVLMKTLTMLFADISEILGKVVKVRMQKMHFDAHVTVHISKINN